MKNSTTENSRGNCKNAFTLLELIIVIAVIAIAAGLLLPASTGNKVPAIQVKCVSNLKQIGLAFRIWEGDNNGRFPMQVYTNDMGAQLFVNAADGFRYFQIMSNELSNPQILVCPADKKLAATNFTSDFNGSHISYFIGLDSTDPRFDSFLAGDSNITNGAKIKDGILEITTNQPIGWTDSRHRGGGNVLLADGAVQQFSTTTLRAALQHTGLATNRLLMSDSAGK